MLRARLATAAVAIPLLLLIIFAAPLWVFAIVVGGLAFAGAVEYVGMVFPLSGRARVVGGALGVVTIAAASLGPDRVPLGVAGLVVLGLAWTVACRTDFERGLADLGLTLIGVLYVGLLLPHFTWLRQIEHGPEWVTFVLGSCMLGDTGGYFVGHAIGRRQLAPRISPGKTIEGAVGVVAATVLASGAGKLILLHDLTWTEVLGLGLALGVLAQLGDLSESIMKRAFGVKESGWMFPGHGGVLDRIDSLLFPVSFVYYYAVWVR